MILGILFIAGFAMAIFGPMLVDTVNSMEWPGRKPKLKPLALSKLGLVVDEAYHRLPEAVRNGLEDPRPTLLLLDEANRVKNPNCLEYHSQYGRSLYCNHTSGQCREIMSDYYGMMDSYNALNNAYKEQQKQLALANVPDASTEVALITARIRDEIRITQEVTNEIKGEKVNG